MLDAYAGTVDADGSETLDDALAEVNGYFSGASGEPMIEHSFVALDGDAPISALLVSRHEGMPLIAGERHAHLWVTLGNESAERIYEKLGFRDDSG